MTRVPDRTAKEQTMTDTRTTTRASADVDDTTGAASASRMRPSGRREAQETRRAFTTTEFYAMIIVIAGLLIAGQIDSTGLPEQTSWQLATGVAVAYIVSRGLAKIGSQREYYDMR